jgi:rRNA-processing protein FCF1
MKTILLDTNSLMAISELKIDLFSELEKCCDFKYKIAVLEGTVRELEKIKKEQRLKFRVAARTALQLLKLKNVEVFPHSAGDVDDLLTDYSHGGYLVLTQDVLLKKRLMRPYLTIRQRKRIVVVE